MSETLARDVVARIHRTAVLHCEDRIEVLAANLRALASANPLTESEAWQARKIELTAAYGLPAVDQRKPFAFSSGKAIIPVHGTLINRFSASWGFVTGYNFIRSQVAAAAMDPDVSAIVLDINSFGGMCAGCAETADAIYAAREQKPVIGVVDAYAYSAGYMLASAASRLVVTPTGGVGSIGVVATHVSLAGMLDQSGVEITFIHAGAKKVDGNQYEKLSDRAKAGIQREVDAQYDTFVAQVARNRGVGADAVRATEAGCFTADEAKEKGLCDAVAAPAFALAENEYPDDDSNVDAGSDTTTNHKEGAMPNEQDAQAIATATAEAKAAEKARISAILGHEQAKGREKLAQHLAMETDMTAEAAAGILAAAPVEQAPAADKTDLGAGAFKAAMDKDKQPDVGADGAGGSDKSDDVVGRILGAVKMATGFDPAAVKH